MDHKKIIAIGFAVSLVIATVGFVIWHDVWGGPGHAAKELAAQRLSSTRCIQQLPALVFVQIAGLAQRSVTHPAQAGCVPSLSRLAFTRSFRKDVADLSVLHRK